VRNTMLSCDPTQRGWIAFDTYLPAVKIGEVVRSMGAGRIVASNHSDFAVGDIVSGLVGWQDHVVMNPKGQLNKLPPGTPLELAMSVFGATGITAYFGLIDVGRPVIGETVVVSGAAGATGSVVGQIARIKGCRAIGIAGGAEKCRWLTDEAGFDAAIDYKSESVPVRLKELCPKGIDIFFDNVGGDILDAALARLALRGRVVLAAGSRTTTRPNRLQDPRTTSTWSSSADEWRASSCSTTCRALRRRSARLQAGCRRARSRTKWTCRTVLRTLRRPCGGCSKAATTASSSCASPSEWSLPSSRQSLSAPKPGRQCRCILDCSLRDSSLWRDHFGRKQAYLHPIFARYAECSASASITRHSPTRPCPQASSECCSSRRRAMSWVMRRSMSATWRLAMLSTSAQGR
jgi:NADPH:quinone reductase-like Zn-dependent oxidoreductase